MNGLEVEILISLKLGHRKMSQEIALISLQSKGCIQDAYNFIIQMKEIKELT